MKKPRKSKQKQSRSKKGPKHYVIARNRFGTIKLPDFAPKDLWKMES